MSAKLPRIHLYRNAIRARFHNRSIELVAKENGYSLFILNAQGKVGEGIREFSNRGISGLEIALSNEAVEAMQQLFAMSTQHKIEP